MNGRILSDNVIKKGCIYGLVISLIISCTSTLIFSAEESNNDSYNFISSINFSFEKPIIKPIEIENNCYDRVIMQDAPSSGDLNMPSLPAKRAHILIPQGSHVKEILASSGDCICLGSGFLVEPCSTPLPYSHMRDSMPIVVPDKNIYSSKDIFPGKLFTNVGTYCFRGYEILVLMIHPVQYIPSTGELFYYNEITIDVETIEDGSINPLYRGLEIDEQEVMQKVDNPYVTDTYTVNPSRALSSESYDLLIITIDDFKAGFEPLKQAHELNGLNTLIYSVEDIYTNYTGVDKPQMIRNFIIDAYMNWSIEYVLLGGDDVYVYDHYIVPTRGLYVTSHGCHITEGDMPSDFYYGCLDGTFNYDCDDRWGEPTDGKNGGDIDMLAEVYVGRACVGKISEVENFVDKTIAYMNIPCDDPYFKEVLWVGEYLGFSGIADFGSNYKDEMINGSSEHGYTTVGVPNDEYNISKLYDRDWPDFDIHHPWSSGWPTSELVNRINNNIHFINHLGHGWYEHCMGLYNTNVYDLTNEKPCFIYSQSCMAGGFDQDDCIAETFTVKTTYGAIAGVWNARYGVGVYNSTDGPSQRFDREFWDAVFGENITVMSKANQDSKEDNLYRINEMFMRWCYYQLNYFGDPAIAFFNDDSKKPPDNPKKPSGPTNGITGELYTFQSSATDSDRDRLKYGWDWDGDDTVDEWDDNNGNFYPAGQNVTMSHTWTSAGTYYIKVKASDDEYESNWSDSLQITIISNSKPDLKIKNITGLFGISASIINKGDANASDVKWSIELDGGLVLMPFERCQNGTFSKIKTGEDESISTFIFALGRINIKIEVECSDSSDKETVSAFALGPFILNIQ